jgi:hypothetical protein
LVIFEDYLRISFWSEYYNENTTYICFEIFKSYFQDAGLVIDREKLFHIEEEIFKNCLDFQQNEKSKAFNLQDLTCEKEPKADKTYESSKETILSHSKSTTKKLVNFDPYFKFIKKENIDKVIVRSFRKYLKEKYRKNELKTIDTFWNAFIHENLIPPIKQSTLYLGENLNFKSFNSDYMVWLFSHEGGVELYEQFYKKSKDVIENKFKDKVRTKQNNSELRFYIKNFASINIGLKLPNDDTRSEQTDSCEDEVKPSAVDMYLFFNFSNHTKSFEEFIKLHSFDNLFENRMLGFASGFDMF